MEQWQPALEPWTCMGCQRHVPAHVRAAIRGPFLSLMAPTRGNWSDFRALCPHCAEQPYAPGEVEVYGVAGDILRGCGDVLRD